MSYIIITIVDLLGILTPKKLTFTLIVGIYLLYHNILIVNC